MSLNHTKYMEIIYVALFGCSVFTHLCLNIRKSLNGLLTSSYQRIKIWNKFVFSILK
jgi:hypothetical protein